MKYVRTDIIKEDDDNMIKYRGLYYGINYVFTCNNNKNMNVVDNKKIHDT